VKKEIGIYQCEFCQGKFTTGQIFTLKQILEKCREFNIGVHHIFEDYEAAYNCINRSELYKAM
jgi:sorting nexin-29